MLVTEQEAARKACPFAASFNASHGRQYFSDGYSKRETDHARCIGSSCMAWDWLDPLVATPSTYIIKPDGTGAPLGKPVSQRYQVDAKSGEAAETKEQFIERLTKIRTVEGFVRNEKFAVDSVSGWSQPHPAPRGQCLRAVTVTEE